jgi:hypothetical protein
VFGAVGPLSKPGHRGAKGTPPPGCGETKLGFVFWGRDCELCKAGDLGAISRGGRWLTWARARMIKPPRVLPTGEICCLYKGSLPLRLLHSSPCSSPSRYPRERPTVVVSWCPLRRRPSLAGFVPIPPPWICFDEAPLRRPRGLSGGGRLLPSSSIFLLLVGSSSSPSRSAFSSSPSLLLLATPLLCSDPQSPSLLMAMMLGFVIVVVVHGSFV